MKLSLTYSLLDKNTAVSGQTLVNQKFENPGFIKRLYKKAFRKLTVLEQVCQVK